jgi:hypothetical protein
LPTFKYTEKTIFESPSYVNIPVILDPVHENDERCVMEQFVQELNQHFMTELAAEVCVDREAGVDEEEGEQDVLRGKRVIVVGASHGARIAMAMEDIGAIVIDLSCPGWRITPENVNSMGQQLTSVLAEKFDGETLILYQLLDNSFYLACDAAGIRSLPVKGSDGKYHVPGRLVTANREEVRRLFTEALPLLRGGGDASKFLLTPLVRYLGKACCSDMTHVINSSDNLFASGLADKLGEVKDWMGGLAFTRRLRNYAVICPNELLKQEDVSKSAAIFGEYWASDPVHMSKEGYQDLAKKLLERMVEAELKRPTGKKVEAAKSTFDWAASRSDWVNRNDTAVHRIDTDGGNRRGRGGWRGGRGRGRGYGNKTYGGHGAYRPKPY